MWKNNLKDKRSPKKIKAYYAVARGRKVGIYTNYPDCLKQIKDYRGARFKKFKTRKEASHFISVNALNKGPKPMRPNKGFKEMKVPKHRGFSEQFNPLTLVDKIPEDAKYIVYFHGLNNIKEQTGAYAYSINNLINGKVKDCTKIDHKTTNGRLLLKALNTFLLNGKGIKNRKVILVSDSQYLVDLLTKSTWLATWCYTGFVTTNGTRVKNVDLLKTIVRRIQDYPNLVIMNGSIDQHTKSLASQKLALNSLNK